MGEAIMEILEWQFELGENLSFLINPKFKICHYFITNPSSILDQHKTHRHVRGP
jgi:hypothetical protein